LPEFKVRARTDNFLYGCLWQNCLYVSVEGDIAEINNSYQFSFIGPLQKYPAMLKNGVVTGIICDDKNLYVSYTLDAGGSVIFSGRERNDSKYGIRWEWTPLVNSSYTISAINVMQRTGEGTNLWFYLATTARPRFVRLSSSPLADAYYVYSTQGYIITTYFDANYDIWQKLFYQLWTIAQNLTTSGINIKIYYEADNDTSWTLLSEATYNSIKNYNIPNVIACNKIRLKIELNTNNTSVSPILTSFILRGILQPESTWIIDFAVVSEQADNRKPTSDLAFLRGGRNSKTPIIIRELKSNRTSYVTFLPGYPTEIPINDEAGKQTGFGIKIKAQELNWTPS
jgi:hypothetical protein